MLIFFYYTQFWTCKIGDDGDRLWPYYIWVVSQRRQAGRQAGRCAICLEYSSSSSSSTLSSLNFRHTVSINWHCTYDVIVETTKKAKQWSELKQRKLMLNKLSNRHFTLTIPYNWFALWLLFFKVFLFFLPFLFWCLCANLNTVMWVHEINYVRDIKLNLLMSIIQ